MIYMKLCPNCRTIQKGGSVCGICKCPVPDGAELEDSRKSCLENSLDGQEQGVMQSLVVGQESRFWGCPGMPWAD